MKLQGLHEWANEHIRQEFYSFGGWGRYYSARQREFALKQINEFGVRATSRILRLPRRTLQRWCRKRRYRAERYPPWMDEWAEKKRRRSL